MNISDVSRAVLATPARPETSKPPAAESQDRATFSATALALAKDSTGQGDNLGRLSRIAHSDPGQAERLAYDFARVTDRPLVDISRLASGDPVRYVATGELVTADNEKALNEQAAHFRQAALIFTNRKGQGHPCSGNLRQDFVLHEHARIAGVQNLDAVGSG